jgi:hypothetical protein
VAEEQVPKRSRAQCKGFFYRSYIVLGFQQRILKCIQSEGSDLLYFNMFDMFFSFTEICSILE